MLKNNYKTVLLYVIPTSLFLILIVLIFPSISFHQNAETSVKNPINTTSCNCVIFRIDDIQDSWHDAAQIRAMDVFLSKNKSLTTALIMNSIGNDSQILKKVKEGYQKGVFELALHGWNHEDFSKLNEQNQQSLLQNSNNKMKLLFGVKSNVFIAPLAAFNNDTIKALSLTGIPILSSMNYEENTVNNNKDIFVFSDNAFNKNNKSNSVLHIPGTIEFKQYINNSWIKTPLVNISTAISNNIKLYGYAVIVIHPQDFILIDNKGQSNDVPDATSPNDLSFLIDDLVSKGIKIISYSDLVNYGNNYK